MSKSGEKLQSYSKIITTNAPGSQKSQGNAQYRPLTPKRSGQQIKVPDGTVGRSHHSRNFNPDATGTHLVAVHTQQVPLNGTSGLIMSTTNQVSGKQGGTGTSKANFLTQSLSFHSQKSAGTMRPLKTQVIKKEDLKLDDMTKHHLSQGSSKQVTGRLPPPPIAAGWVGSTSN